MRVVTVAGAAMVVFSVGKLPVAELGWSYLLLALLTVVFGSRITVDFFRFNSCISISDIFIFVTLLLFDGEAAILLAAMEGFSSSLRITKSGLKMAFNSACMASATFVTVWTLRLVFGSIPEVARGQFSGRLILMACLMAISQHVVNSGLIAVAGALLANRQVWATYKEHYLWTSITYFAGASAAVITLKLIAVVGFFAFIATMPIVLIVYFTYVSYIKSVAASTAQVEQAGRHLAEMQESEERFRSAFDLAPIGMALVSSDGHFAQVNQSLCDILGYTDGELKGRSFRDLTNPNDLQIFQSHIDQVLDSRLLNTQMETRYRHKLGYEVCALVGISLIRDSQSSSLHLILQIQDITDRKRAEQQLLHEAFHDGLTGLPNRAWFMEQLEASLDQSRLQPGRLFAVLFLDLDRFKLINDSIGHMVGDQLLIGIAQRLRNGVRPGDKIARLGGDEFTILLDGIRDVQEAEEIAERIQKLVSQPFILSGYEAYTTVSIGLALSNLGYVQPEDFLRDADTAMYHAKSLGKARYAIFDKGMHANAVNLLQLETDLRRAIDRGEFFLEYQPIVALETGRLTGFEALVRWQHPERGLVSPIEFISVAEDTGYIVPIGRWVLFEACRQMQQWREAHALKEPLSISVNLSSKQFTHANLLEQIVEVLRETRLDPLALKLEITESIVMENIEAASGMLEQLRALGVELSIDDFGTGYSSLSYLHRLPIDTLKIDRSFVTQMDENNENKEIIRTIILLAQNLNKGVIAEGVETKEQVALLRAWHCQGAQGFYFSRPLKAEAADKMVRDLAQRQGCIPGFEEDYEQESFIPLASPYQM